MYYTSPWTKQNMYNFLTRVQGFQTDPFSSSKHANIDEKPLTLLRHFYFSTLLWTQLRWPKLSFQLRTSFQSSPCNSHLFFAGKVVSFSAVHVIWAKRPWKRKLGKSCKLTSTNERTSGKKGGREGGRKRGLFDQRINIYYIKTNEMPKWAFARKIDIFTGPWK